MTTQRARVHTLAPPGALRDTRGRYYATPWHTGHHNEGLPTVARHRRAKRSSSLFPRRRVNSRPAPAPEPETVPLDDLLEDTDTPTALAAVEIATLNYPDGTAQQVSYRHDDTEPTRVTVVRAPDPVVITNGMAIRYGRNVIAVVGEAT